MDTLASPRRTVEILRKFGIRADKRFGQNFLVDPNILMKIINIADLKKDDVVLEIGPGIGSLTQMLASKTRLVVAIEYDISFQPALLETLQHHNVQLFFEDALKLDCDAFFKGCPLPNKMVSNLPYNIATPLMAKLLEECPFIDEFVITVQKEVAERMTAEIGTKSYGSFTLKVNFYAEPKIRAVISPNAFFPAPKVSSSVVKLKRIVPPVSVDDRAAFFRLIETAFAQRRKTIVNNFLSGDLFRADKQTWVELMLSAGISPERRAEALTLADFALLYQKIGEFSA